MATLMSTSGTAGSADGLSRTHGVDSAPLVQSSTTPPLTLGGQAPHPLAPRVLPHTNDDPMGVDRAAQHDVVGKYDASSAIVSHADDYMPNIGCAAHVISGMPAGTLTHGQGCDTSFMFSSMLTMRTVIHGMTRQACATTLYRIGARAKQKTSLIPDCVSPAVCIRCEPTPAYTALLDPYVNRKILVSSHELSTAAIVERLAKAISKFSIWGVLTLKDLCASESANIRILSGRTQSAILPTELFIPSELWHADRQAMAVIMYAASAAGTMVVLDNLPVEKNGRPEVPYMVDGKLAIACYKALVYLGQLADICNQGSLWAYAFTRGIHACATVISHTDEGGYVRYILRRGAFEKPCGVLPKLNPTSWSGIPLNIGNSLAAIQNVVMSCLLSTAAGVALADPTVTIGEQIMPEVLTVEQNQPLLDFTCTETSVDDDEVQLRAAQVVAENCERFSRNYIYVLTKLFGYGYVNYEAAYHLVAAFSWYTVEKHSYRDTANGVTRDKYLVDRHLLRTGHYWFWIEPTSILSTSFSEMPAAAIMSGPRVLPFKSQSYPALPKAVKYVQALGATGAVLDFSSARRCPAIDFLRESPKDGLAYMRVAGLNPGCVACSGVDDSKDKLALNTLLAQRPSLAKLCWKRSDARVNAPAELLVLGTHTAITLIHNTCVTEAGGVRPTPLPMPDELSSWTITYSTTAPTYVGVFANASIPPRVRQMRGKAAAAFAAAAQSYEHGPVSAWDWFSPMDVTLLTSYQTNVDVAQNIVTNSTTAELSVGATTAAVLDAYLDDVEDIAETIPGDIEADTPAAGENVKLAPAEHKDKVESERKHAQPLPVGDLILDWLPDQLHEVDLNGWERFKPVELSDGDFKARCWLALDEIHGKNARHVHALMPYDGPDPELYVARSISTQRMIVGTLSEGIRTDAHGGETAAYKITDATGLWYWVDWTQPVKKVICSELFNELRNMDADALSEHGCVCISGKLPTLDGRMVDKVIMDGQLGSADLGRLAQPARTYEPKDFDPTL